MAKYMNEFNVGDKICDTSDGLVVEILQKFKNRNVKFKTLQNPNCVYGFPIGAVEYVHNTDNPDSWEFYEEHSKNISPESIKELEKSIQKEKSNLNEFVENTRKNISDMEKSLEKLKKTANKIPTIEVGQMYSYNNSNSNDIVAICVESCSFDDSYTMILMDCNDGVTWEWIYDKDFEDGSVTDFKHLNSPEQKKIAAGFYAFYTGDIPGV